ncbi:MAG: phosphoenolpyruvate carboxykinase, partial [Actinomycetota bacterium]|nr:phosphoenolpyruvate carboxykinase [Actinomycetota bacterium]
GFGENARVLEWMLERVDGQVGAKETPLGYLPTSLNLEGLPPVDWDQLFEIDRPALLAEADDTEKYFAKFGSHLPDAMVAQLDTLRAKLNRSE